MIAPQPELSSPPKNRQQRRFWFHKKRGIVWGIFYIRPKERKITGAPTREQVAALFAEIAKREREAAEPPRGKAQSGLNRRHLRSYHLHERFLMVALGTGRRAAEIHSRKWEDFDLENRRLTLDNAHAVGA